MKERKGFTLVDLLTAMGVITILISLCVPACNIVIDEIYGTPQQQEDRQENYEGTDKYFNR